MSDLDELAREAIESGKFRRVQAGVTSILRTARAASLPNHSPAVPTAPAKTGVSPSLTPVTPFKLRPKCKNPDHCGGYGRNHCRACVRDEVVL